MADKKLRSKSMLTYNTGLHTESTSVVEGKILNVAISGKFDKIAVQYAYYDSNGVIIERNAWEIDGQAEINQLFNDIKPDLPPSVDYTSDRMIEFYTGFLYIAAQSWSNLPTDWEIIDDVV